MLRREIEVSRLRTYKSSDCFRRHLLKCVTEENIENQIADDEETEALDHEEGSGSQNAPSSNSTSDLNIEFDNFHKVLVCIDCKKIVNNVKKHFLNVHSVLLENSKVTELYSKYDVKPFKVDNNSTLLKPIINVETIQCFQCELCAFMSVHKRNMTGHIKAVHAIESPCFTACIGQQGVVGQAIEHKK